MKKIFILDTNVILFDYNAIYNFEDNHVVIPIVVIEELDKFKKGNAIINYNARQIMRELDKLTSQYDIHADGITLSNNKGKLFVETVHKFSEEFKNSFSEHKYADTKILSIALYLKKEQEKKDKEKHQVILVTQDVNLRLKARTFGIIAQDYKTGKIDNVNSINKEINTLVNVETQLINNLYENREITAANLIDKQNNSNNEYHILTDGNATALGYYNTSKNIIKLVKKRSAYSIKPRNSEQTFALDALLRKDIKLISITGRAGTGKTLLALAAALQQNKKFYQIMLARPIVALSDKDLGYLPGDATDKIKPYMQPLFDNLTVIKQNAGINSKDSSKIDQFLKEDKLLITPLAYIRGRSLSNVFFIIDEAQNLTPHEIKTIITRAGERTKIVFTGDIDQIDSPYLDDRSNGLSYLTEKMRGQKIFAHINLVKGERSELAELASKLL